MNALIFYGALCTLDIWNQLDPRIKDIHPLYVEYPHDVLQRADSLADLTNWVRQTLLNEQRFDCLIGHSMGGLIALELAAIHRVPCRKVILIESNLKPANPFYRNLMTAENQLRFGDQINKMFQSEAPYYQDSLKKSLQQDFDFTPLVRGCPAEIHAIYGDRGQPDYPDRIADLCLDEETTSKIHFHFVKDACHLPMIENPTDLAKILKAILNPSGQ